MICSESRAADAISATRVSRSGCRFSAASVRSASDPTPVTTTTLVWPRGSSSSTSTAPPDRRAATGKACYEISRYKYTYCIYVYIYLQPSMFLTLCWFFACIYHYFAPRAWFQSHHLLVFLSLLPLPCSFSPLPPLPPSQLHLSSDEGCQFSLVECPLAVFGCQKHSLMRRDLNRHMTDKHTKHITTVIGESPIRITEEPPNKGHYGGSDCREVVPISEVK